LAAAVLYAGLLLTNARLFSGIFKLTFGMAIYLLFACIFASPLFYLIREHRETSNESMVNQLLVLLSYAVIMAPSLVYLLKYKIKSLQRAGYFLPRK
jgi:glucan phosphoethanolaminetransferase (alkaline phosphatase superfamily)